MDRDEILKKAQAGKIGMDEREQQVLGLSFGIRSLIAMLGLSLTIDYVPLPAATNDLLLATVFGGVVLGIGVGVVIRSGGCIDGTEMVAILISRKTSLSVGQTILCFNIVIYCVAGFLFGCTV